MEDSPSHPSKSGDRQFSLGEYIASNVYLISNIPPRSETRPRPQPPPPPPPNLELSAHYNTEHDVLNFRSYIHTANNIKALY